MLDDVLQWKIRLNAYKNALFGERVKKATAPHTNAIKIGRKELGLIEIANEESGAMRKSMSKKSLVVSSSIVLSILFVVLIGVMNYLSYSAQKQAFYDEFVSIGDKLRDQARANARIIEPVAAALDAGQELPETQMEILERLLNAMPDGKFLANAYYVSAKPAANGDQTEIKFLQVSESLKAKGLNAGDSYIANETFFAAYEQALSDQSELSDMYSDDLGDWISYFAPIMGADGKVIAIFGVDYDYDSVEARMSSLVMENVIFAIIVSLISIAIVVFLVRMAIKPLIQLVDRARAAAAGDLTVQVPVTSGNEIGQAATAFNEMIASLRELTVHIDKTSTEVSQSSGSLKEMAGQTEAATHEISSAIQSVASGAETQLVSSKECQRAMNEMAVGIQRIAESSSTVSELAADTSQLAVQGEVVMSQTVEQMQAIQQQVSSAAGVMQELNHSSNRIGDILARIFEIANQTNLLALNASIEAARAGEYGKGFAVVAHEIRALAERSKQSSDEISGILQGISTRSQEVTDSLSQSADETRKGSELVNASGESFRAILQAVKQVSQQVQEVSAASEQMSAGSEEIAASMVELERMANTTASHSQQVAAASEEQLASVQEVAASSQQLQQLANELREAVGKFKV